MFNFPSSSTSTHSSRRREMTTAKEEIREQLSSEARYKCREGHLSDELKRALEELTQEDLRDVVNSVDSMGSTPLFDAAKMGNLDIARYLVERCGANLEVRGVMDSFGESRPHVGTPLWVASVYGGVNMVNYLISQGAFVNTTSNSRSTPLRSACFMTNIPVIESLLAAGANVHITNQCGGSCLTNSVQSPPLLQILLNHRAEVNVQDHQGNTPLHYAIMERRLDATMLLVENGANINLPNIFGQSAMSLAAFKGDKPIFDYLQTIGQISQGDEADVLELLAVSILDRSFDEALAEFIKAVKIREEHRIQKPCLDYVPPYACQFDRITGEVLRAASEFTTVAEWESLNGPEVANHPGQNRNHKMVQIQAQFIRERQLGKYHKTFLKKLSGMAQYERNFFYAHSVTFYALRLYTERDQNGLLDLNTAAALEGLIETHLAWTRENIKQEADGFDVVSCPFGLRMEILKFIVDELPDISREIQCHPFFPPHRRCYQLLIVACSRLLSLLLNQHRTDDEMKEITSVIVKLKKFAVPIFGTGDHLLHLAVRRFDDFTYYEKQIPLCFQYVELLVRFGCDVNCVNDYGETPLHILLKSSRFVEDDIAEVLVNAGTHLDHYDDSNFLPITKLLEKPFPGFPLQAPIRLQCITAKYLATLGISFYSSYLHHQHLINYVTRHTTLDTCGDRSFNKVYERLNHYDYDDY